MKFSLITFCISLLTPLTLFAPAPTPGVIPPAGANDYSPNHHTPLLEAAFKAVCAVESKSNPLYHNEHENAVGVAQIRQIRVDDYNLRTGSYIKLEDCYNVEVSRRIFMYYAELYGVDHMDEAIKRWNGSGEKTDKYLEKVKQQLKNQ
jgi:hypothetical protein